jgi:hypothetical protein
MAVTLTSRITLELVVGGKKEKLMFGAPDFACR